MYITSIGTDDTQGRDRKKNGTHCHHADRDWWRKGKWYGRPYHAPLSVGTAASARYYDLERAKVKLGSSFGHSLAVNVTSYRNCVRAPHSSHREWHLSWSVQVLQTQTLLRRPGCNVPVRICQ